MSTIPLTYTAAVSAIKTAVSSAIAWYEPPHHTRSAPKHPSVTWIPKKITHKPGIGVSTCTDRCIGTDEYTVEATVHGMTLEDAVKIRLGLFTAINKIMSGRCVLGQTSIDDSNALDSGIDLTTEITLMIYAMNTVLPTTPVFTPGSVSTFSTYSKTTKTLTNGIVTTSSLATTGDGVLEPGEP